MLMSGGIPGEGRLADGAADERRRQTILVFSGELLPPSQTFVRDHVENIRAFDRLMLGVRRVPGLDVSHLETMTLPASRIARLVLWLFGYSRQLDELVREKRVVLIHAHFADAGMKIARYARRRKLPLFVTLHGSDVLTVRKLGLPMRLLDLYLRRGMKASTSLFLAVSDYIKAAAVAVGYPESRVRTHLLGVPLAKVVVPRPGPDCDREPIILFVGRLVEKKGLPYLLAACRQLSDEGLRFTLRIAGEGPLAASCREQAASMAANVEFLGLLSPAQVREQMSVADIFCMPSTQAPSGDNEGLPIVYLEAQDAGLPVVAFNQGPIPEAVLDGVTGILAKDKSVDALAGALKVLLEEPDLRRKMGVAGRQLVKQRFDIQKQSQELDDLYSAVLSGEMVS
jgi:colanic acid/amylovoran biosynthesis glycosyltransferase